MSGWYNKITADPDNLLLVINANDFYEDELKEALAEVNEDGNIETISAMIPGIVSFRFNQFQEVEAILEFLNIKLRKIKTEKFKFFMEKYDKTLTTRDADRYADGEPEIIDLSLIINLIALTRNKYMGIIKGLETKHFQLSNIIKLRIAGMEDSEINNIYIKRK